MSLIAFPREGFRVHSELITDIDRFGVEHATDAVRRLKARVSPPTRAPAARATCSRMLLVDGLSNAEENIVAAIHWEIDDIELIGGSAGDGICFKRTVMIHNGEVAHRAAILMMIETDYPFRVFKTQNFEPTGIKLVVTAADTENRIVHELNAEPAAREYAAAIGLLPDDLGPFSFASYPLVVKVGGDYYCRSIRNMNPDGSLSFFCAIDEGLVFTVARPRDMLSATTSMLAGARQRRSAASTSSSGSIASCGGLTPRRVRSAIRWTSCIGNTRSPASTPMASSTTPCTSIRRSPASPSGSGRRRHSVMIEKFANASCMLQSEFLDLNHSSKL